MKWIEYIKLLFSMKGPIGELITEVKEAKTGWKTPHFWGTVLLTLGTIAAAVGGLIPATTGVAITVGLTTLYQIARAIENSQMEGVQPVLTSTRFWVGVVGILSAGLISLKTGGIDPKWVEGAIAFLASVMAIAQNIGAVQPTATSATIPPAS